MLEEIKREQNHYLDDYTYLLRIDLEVQERILKRDRAIIFNSGECHKSKRAGANYRI